MRKLLSCFVLLWLTACASFVPYVPSTPLPFYAQGYTWAYEAPDKLPVFTVANGLRVQVIGTWEDWYVVPGKGKKLLLIPQAALLLDPGIEPGDISDNYYYPHGRISHPSPLPAGTSGYTPSGYTTGGESLNTGPRGGQYYINGNGNKTYITPQSTIDREPIQTGPRGGQYYINGSGRKTYIKH